VAAERLLVVDHRAVRALEVVEHEMARLRGGRGSAGRRWRRLTWMSFERASGRWTSRQALSSKTSPRAGRA
jgi:hypothetical protein